MRENLTSGSTGGSWKRNILTTGAQKNDPAGNRRSTWLRALPPGQVTAYPDPTNLGDCHASRQFTLVENVLLVNFGSSRMLGRLNAPLPPR
jgi:hypothetical protein